MLSYDATLSVMNPQAHAGQVSLGRSCQDTTGRSSEARRSPSAFEKDAGVKGI